jgi:hypothetical protein
LFDWHLLVTPLPPSDPLDCLDTPEIMGIFYEIHPMTALYWIRLRRVWRAGYFHDDDEVVA